MSNFPSSCLTCNARTEPGQRYCPQHLHDHDRPSSCDVCGRRAIGNRCELHPMTEAERIAREPWRIGYRSPVYRRNRLIVLKRANGTCECGCGRPLGDKPHVGHRQALADGGSDELSNLRAMRAGCNYRQMGRDMSARRRGRTT